MNLTDTGGRMKGGIVKSLGWAHIYIVIFKIDDQQGTTVYHRELCSILYNNLSGKII